MKNIGGHDTRAGGDLQAKFFSLQRVLEFAGTKPSGPALTTTKIGPEKFCPARFFARVGELASGFLSCCPPDSSILAALTGVGFACDEAEGFVVSQDGSVNAVETVEGRQHFWDGTLD